MPQPTQSNANAKQEKLLKLRHEILTEAHLRKLYADRAVAVGEDNLEELMNRYMQLSEEHRERYEELSTEADKLK